MRLFFPIQIDNITALKTQLLTLSEDISHFCFLDSNNYPNYPYSTFGSLFAIDAIDSISVNHDCLAQFEAFQQKNKDWLFGYLSYDLKNEIESNLHSLNFDGIQHPLLHFFVPKYLVKIEKNKIEVGVYGNNDIEIKHNLEHFYNILESPKSSYNLQITNYKLPQIQQRFSKQDYLETIDKIKAHIVRGDMYEMNLCQEFFAHHAHLHPLAAFEKLNAISKAPFTSYFKNQENYLLCASPERFLKRQKNKLISQPIKGTRKRGSTEAEDKQIKQDLFFNEKERSENVMIVDLVRNDFSRIALDNTVDVEELFGIYSFEQVHQLISTITCRIAPQATFSDIIRATFPMGSMTGAPKISALHIIESLEKTKRGLFSGCVGYITPNGNFDFNVVIRSILYNSAKKYLSIQAGSAITIDCNAEQEYEECLLKAQAMFKALNA